MPGRARASSVDPRPATTAAGPNAWIAGLEQKILYDLEPLARGDQVRTEFAFGFVVRTSYRREIPPMLREFLAKYNLPWLDSRTLEREW